MTSDYDWAKRTKWLTQALILSGTLNIALIATFAYVTLKDKEHSLVLELAPKPSFGDRTPTNVDLLRSYSLLPYQELILKLENKELVEEGLSKRDLALSCLCAFHHFNLDKALGGIPLQTREISFTNSSSNEKIHLPLFSGLSDIQFLAVLNYAKTEKWPLTSQGLFYEIKRGTAIHDPSLLTSFCFTPEYQSAYILLTKSGLPVSKEDVLSLLAEGNWEQIKVLHQEQRTALDVSIDKRCTFLSSYLDHNSKRAAALLTAYDTEFVLKRLSDAQVLTLLDLSALHTPQLEQLAKDLLLSPRTEPVFKKAASLLYAWRGEEVKEPYDHIATLQKFCPDRLKIQQAIATPSASMQVNNPTSVPIIKKKVHVVEPGENLWKIARKYRVSIDAIMRANHLESDKVRPGRELEIPPSAKN